MCFAEYLAKSGKASAMLSRLVNIDLISRPKNDISHVLRAFFEEQEGDASTRMVHLHLMAVDRALAVDL